MRGLQLNDIYGTPSTLRFCQYLNIDCFFAHEALFQMRAIALAARTNLTNFAFWGSAHSLLTSAVTYYIRDFKFGLYSITQCV